MLGLDGADFIPLTQGPCVGSGRQGLVLFRLDGSNFRQLKEGAAGRVEGSSWRVEGAQGRECRMSGAVNHAPGHRAAFGEPPSSLDPEMFVQSSFACLLSLRFRASYKSTRKRDFEGGP